MRRVTLLLVAFVLAMPLWAGDNPQVQIPKDIPPYGPLKATPSPDLKQAQLPNGLTVWLLPRPGYPKVTFLLTLRGGLAVDPKSQPGISEFLVAAVGQGTATRTAKQIAEQLQAAGGELRVESSPDVLTLRTTLLAARLESGLAAFADVAQKANFPDAEVEVARASLLNSLQRRRSDATFMARRVLAAMMFGDHPYSIIGLSPDTLARITAADLRAEYARRFRPDAAMLLVIGDFNADLTMKAVQQRFGAWQSPAGEEVRQVPAPKQGNRAKIFVVPRPNSVQTRFYIGSLGPAEGDHDYAAASVATLVYGTRVSKNVREDKGYAYSSGAQSQPQRATNMLVTAASVRNAVTGAAFNEMVYEMNRMATTSPTKQEVERVQHFLIGYEALSLQTQTGMAQRLSQLWTSGLSADELGRNGKAIEKVTIADVERIGRDYLSAPRMTVVAVGDEKTIKDQLSSFGLEIKTEH